MSALFLHPAKAGGTTFRKSVRKAGYYPDIINWHRKDVHSNKVYKGSFVITTKRCPFKRMVSYYLFLKRKSHPLTTLARSGSFERFVLKGSSFMWYQVMPCFEYVEKADFVIDVENYEEDFNKCFETLGVKAPEILIHNTSLYDRDWQSFYTEKSVDVVYRRFHKDVTILGYKPPNV